MIFKIFKAFSAPFVWHFTDPDTGQVFEALNRQELLRLVIAYRKQNELEPIEMLPVVVENFNCLRPENKHKCTDNKKLHRSFFGYLKGGIALLKYYFMVKQVDDSIADKRSEQCAVCPLNVFPDKGPFLEWSDSVAEAATGGRKSARHDDLGNCEGCSCVLKMKVFAQAPFELDEEERKKLAAVDCWQLKE